jgi:hypothetical protein
MSRVLIVSYLFPPFNGPGTQHPTWFYRYLREYGFETVALTSSVYFGTPDVSSPASDPCVVQLPRGHSARRLTYQLYRAELWAQLRFEAWEPGFAWGGMFGVPAATKLLKRERFAAMISVSPTISSHWTALRLKRRFPDLKWIADFQDPFVGNPFKKENIVKRLENQLEQDIFSTADYLSANTDTARDLWQQRYPQFTNKMGVTWGGFDPEEPINALPLPPDEPPVMKHVGALYDGRHPTALLQSLERLVAQGRLRPGDLAVEFVGSLKFGVLAPLVADLERKGFIRLRPTYVPREEALAIAASAHYSLVLDIAPQNAVLQVPAKVFDQIRIGRPILAFTPAGSPTERILEDSGVPYVSLAPDAPGEEVDAGILRLLQMPPAPKTASSQFLDTFSARHLAGMMAARIRGERV